MTFIPVEPTIELSLAFFGLGHWELIIVLLIILVVFGAGKLPTVGSALGKGIRNFRSSVSGKDDGNDEKETESNEESEKEPKSIEAPKAEMNEVSGQNEKKSEESKV